MEYLGIIVAMVGSIIALIAVVIALFLWTRAEARSDARHNDSKLESTRELVRAIHLEVKDFHGRLCSIEERRLKDK
jgi:uncharacterized membrane protein